MSRELLTAKKLTEGYVGCVRCGEPFTSTQPPGWHVQCPNCGFTQLMPKLGPEPSANGQADQQPGNPGKERDELGLRPMPWWIVAAEMTAVILPVSCLMATVSLWVDGNNRAANVAGGATILVAMLGFQMWLLADIARSCRNLRG